MASNIMSTYRLSKRSLQRLEGVHPQLCSIVHEAISLTEVDFGVTCGLRTVRAQQELYDRGATKTMHSKHLTGLAVDVVAYIGPRISWELALYDEIAEAFKEAAIHHTASVRWGGAWTVSNISVWRGTMEEAMNSYVDKRRSQGRRPFIDAPHFELS